MKLRGTIKQAIALILTASIIITTVYKDELFATSSVNVPENLPASLQAHTINIKVKGHALDGTHIYDNILANYKDGILMTLSDETNVIEDRIYTDGQIDNSSSLYGMSYRVESAQSNLSSTILTENEIQLNSDTVTSSEEGCILYSKNGNIEIFADNISINGFLYAPAGKVLLSGKNIEINGAIVADEIDITADEFAMNGYSEEDMGNLEWIQIGNLNNNYIGVDEESNSVVFQMDNSYKTEIFARKSSENEFQLIHSTQEEAYSIGIDGLAELTDFRTSINIYGETYLSDIVTVKNAENKIELSFLDSDNDGIPDGYEIWDLKTDPYNIDTDGDGFDDGYEVFILGSDPLVATADEDNDSDGLTNKMEMEQGTNPNLADSDFDGIPDAEDANPLVTDVDSGRELDYTIKQPSGAFHITERYFDENQRKCEITYNSINGQRLYINTIDEEIHNVYDAKGNMTAEIKKTGDEYIVNTYSFDEAGNKTSLSHNGMRYDYTFDDSGNVTSAKLGNIELEKNTYEGDQIKETVYGNGDTESYEYNADGNVTKSFKNGELLYEWEYNEQKSPAVYKDHMTSKVYTYEYDTDGYLLKQICSDGFEIEYIKTEVGVETVYKYKDEALSKSIQINEDKDSDEESSIELVYGDDKFVVTVAENMLESHFEAGNQKVVQTEVAVAEGLVESEKTNGDNIEYTYDEQNNITAIVKNGAVDTTYEYDSLNQVVRENSELSGTSTVHEYDLAGNILETAKTKLDFDTPTENLNIEEKTTYEYRNSEWNDLLTQFNGNDIIYDEIGNPTTYYNGMNFTWKVKKLTQINADDSAISYTYDTDGIRTSKTVNGTKTEYLWENDILVAETTNGSTIWYMYDANQMPAGFQYNETSYYLAKNIQGDINAIVNAEGEKLAEYQYDAWGNVISITGDETLGKLNPFRYRGYYQDNETGFYYLTSRYYDSNTKRFLNTDNQLDFGTDHAWANLFAYTGNNCVMKADYSGESTTLIYIGYVLVAIVFVAVTHSLFTYYWKRNAEKIALAIDRALAKLGNVFRFCRYQTRALAREIGASFARVKTRPKYRTKKERHHICAKGARNMFQARNSLEKAGYHVEDGVNIIYLKTGLHRRVHRNSYYTMANEIIVRSEKKVKNKNQKRINVFKALSILRGVLSALDVAAPY